MSTPLTRHMASVNGQVLEVLVAHTPEFTLLWVPGMSEPIHVIPGFEVLIQCGCDGKTVTLETHRVGCGGMSGFLETSG